MADRKMKVLRQVHKLLPHFVKFDVHLDRAMSSDLWELKFVSRTHDYWVATQFKDRDPVALAHAVEMNLRVLSDAIAYGEAKPR